MHSVLPIVLFVVALPALVVVIVKRALFKS